MLRYVIQRNLQGFELLGFVEDNCQSLSVTESEPIEGGKEQVAEYALIPVWTREDESGALFFEYEKPDPVKGWNEGRQLGKVIISLPAEEVE